MLNAFLIKSALRATRDSEDTGGFVIHRHAEGDWRYESRSAGLNPHVQHDAVFHGEQLVWTLNQLALLSAPAADADAIRAFIDRAREQDGDAREYSEDDWTYRKTWQGERRAFSGTETVSIAGAEAYRIDFHGTRLTRNDPHGIS